MLEMMVLALDQDGLPRAQAWGPVETNEELDNLKSAAIHMLDKYIEGKPYSIDKSDYSFVVEIID